MRSCEDMFMTKFDDSKKNKGITGSLYIAIERIKCVFFAGLVVCSSSIYADVDKVTEVVGEQIKTEQSAIQSQQLIDGLDERSSRMLSEYRQVVAETKSL